jgi:hydrogenase maturation protein HypF
MVRAVEALRAGLIVAVKGLGGFQLMVRADDAEAVRRLRDRKRREEKPFALMFPDIERVREVCECSALEAEILMSPEAPIVLLCRRLGVWGGVAGNVAPGQGNLGVMLPYTPLHHVLMGDLGMGVVATSGNLSDEPICIDEGEAVVRLRGIADGFLVHDRPIVRQVDDSIVRVMAGREMVMRRARGFAPLPVMVGRGEAGGGEAILGVGGHLKNSVVLLEGERAFVSQHIGDLETVEAHDAFRRVVEDLQGLYSVRAGVLAADLHPDYLSTRFAVETGVRVERVQHHVAHIGAVLAESEVRGRVLGVSWDGTGLGWDRAIWGGEFLVGEGDDWLRFGHLLPFRLPGGDLAVREPRRSALGLAAVLGGEAGLRAIEGVRGCFAHGEVDLLLRVMEGGVHAPWTTSMGRLFDGVAALMGLRGRSAFEGQSAMELEALAERGQGGGVGYEFVVERESGADGLVVDWRPVIAGVLGDLDRGIAPEWIAAGFHAAVVELVVKVAGCAGESAVALGGGCFQNRILLEGCVRRLGEEGYRVYWPQRVPPNDGGLALGQVWVASRRLDRGIHHSSNATCI